MGKLSDSLIIPYLALAKSSDFPSSSIEGRLPDAHTRRGDLALRKL
jgi:hypothetical protein